MLWKSQLAYVKCQYFLMEPVATIFSLVNWDYNTQGFFFFLNKEGDACLWWLVAWNLAYKVIKVTCHNEALKIMEISTLEFSFLLILVQVATKMKRLNAAAMRLKKTNKVCLESNVWNKVHVIHLHQFYVCSNGIYFILWSNKNETLNKLLSKRTDCKILFV